jgi:transcriptional regulator with XRE-family HTH domain
MFSHRVREVRENIRPRLTQADLAERIAEQSDSPVTDSKLESIRMHVSRTESGKRIATLNDLVIYARALRVPPSELLDLSLYFLDEAPRELKQVMEEQEKAMEEMSRRFEELQQMDAEYREYLRRKEETSGGDS